MQRNIDSNVRLLKLSMRDLENNYNLSYYEAFQVSCRLRETLIKFFKKEALDLENGTFYTAPEDQSPPQVDGSTTLSNSLVL